MKLAIHCTALFVVLALAVVISAAQLRPVSAANSGPEDFPTASLVGSQLHPDPPELVEKTEEPGYTREWVTVQWRPGDPIYLYVVRPTKVQKPPIVIYLYGFPSETDVYRDDDWCEHVTTGGYAAVGFVPALTGHRYHDRSVKEWFVSELQESLAKSAHDVQMVLNYLATRGDVDMDRVGMFGEGAGGTIAVMAASVDSRIKAIDLLNPWGDWPAWMATSEVIPDEERASYLKSDFLHQVAGFDPVSVLPALKTPHIRLIQSNADVANTPEAVKKHLEAALPRGAEGHRAGNAAEFDAHSLDWLKLQLRPTGSPKSARN
jgi:cephalosporin-C deacetylase-like acetyl esterase